MTPGIISISVFENGERGNTLRKERKEWKKQGRKKKGWKERSMKKERKQKELS